MLSLMSQTAARCWSAVQERPYKRRRWPAPYNWVACRIDIKAHEIAPCCQSAIPQATLVVRGSAALGRHETRIHQASVIQRRIPATAPAPEAPGKIIAVLAVGIAGFSGRTIDALTI